MLKLSLVQNITHIITVADTKIKYSLYTCNIVFHLSLWFNLNSLFRLALFSTVIHERRGIKITGKISKCQLGGSSYLPFLLLKTFETISLNYYRFCQKSRIDLNRKERGGEGANYLCHFDAIGIEVDM